jgi:HAD superfamily hydrolase (TIGR01509 family)
MPPRVTTVLFDLGDVVCRFRPQRRLEALAAASGLPAREIHARLWESGFSQACDSGQYTATTMYERACALLDWQPSYTEFQALWVQAFEPDEAVLSVVDRIRRQVRTGLLTNNPPLLLDALPAFLPQVHQRFEPLLFSYEFGTLKPSAALFTAVLARLRQPADTLLLIDDAAANVDGARAAGMQACVFTTVEALRVDLAAYAMHI